MTGIPADLDRRFYGFTLDRLVAWTVDAAAVFLAWYYLIDRDRVAAGIAVIIAVVLTVAAVLAVVLGLTGSSPGNAALGMRVVDASTSTPIGVRRALLRQLIVGIATLPTFGLGVATLAWTAAMDPSGRRHGWHDRVADSEVVDVRPAPVEPDVVDVGPPQVVNLTAMRLVPAPALPPSPTLPPPPRRPSPAGPPAPPLPPPPSATPEPARQRLGYPLVPEPQEPQEPSARWRVSFDSGESFLVEGPALVGRRPEARSGETVRHLVPLRSSDMSLSKTHAQFQLGADGVLVVTDRGSTNGTFLLRNGAARELAPGRPLTLLDGDHVRFGDREMTVSREA